MSTPLLNDKCAVITGGTRGIGLAIAETFLREGAKVAIVGRDEARTREASEGLCARTGRESGAALPIVADIATSAGAADAMAAAIAAFGGRLDILVNNAGITRDTLILRMGDEEWDAVMDTDLKAVFRCSKAAIKPMIKARCGRIINISSVVALTGNAGQCNYAAAKAGVLGLTRSLAREVASRKITVNAVAPGFVETEMTSKLSDEIRRMAMEHIPLGRFAAPQEIADAVLFLASDRAAYITGQCLSVNGGMAMP